MKTIASALVVLSIATVAARPQQRDRAVPPAAVRAGTASLSGVVVTDTRPTQPLRRVMVTINDANTVARTRLAITDDAGRYAFSSLPAGRYLVTAAKAGFLNTTYGARGPIKVSAAVAGTAVALADGGTASNINMTMTRGAVVTGTVTDVTGLAASFVRVALAYYARSATTGERALTPLGSFSAVTDDRGGYRIFGVPPGDYLVLMETNRSVPGELPTTSAADVQRALELIRDAASGSAATTTSGTFHTGPRRPTVAFATVYYPGTTSLASASLVTLAPSEERSGIDLQLQRVPTARIDGTISGLDGRPMAGVLAGLNQNGVGPGPSTGANGISDAQGRFRILGVAPGSYTVVARTGAGAGPSRVDAPGGRPTWAQTDITIQGEDIDVALTMQPAMTVSGKLVSSASSAGAPEDLTRARVTMNSERSGLTTSPDADGRFSIGGVLPGRYRLSATVPGTAPWSVRSSTIGGRDAIDQTAEIRAGDTGLDALITLTDKSAEINGTMYDAAGQPAPEYFIIVFPAEKTRWLPQSRRIRQVRPAHDGTFRVRDLPAGNYLIAAVTEVEQGEWFDPAFLAKLAVGAIPISVLEGDKKTQDIRIR